MAGKPAEGRKKALRPPIYVRLSEDLDEEVRAIADREERELAVVVRQLVKEGLAARTIGMKLAS